MKQIFKTGDKVFDYVNGWMDVVGDNDFSLMIKDSKQKSHLFYKDSVKTLSFTEYTLEGFSQERPLFNVGDIGYFWDSDTSDIISYGKLTIIDVKTNYPYTMVSCSSYKHFSLTPPDLKY